MIRPEAARLQDAEFVNSCQITVLRKYLPLLWPKGAHTPPSPEKSYRSSYRYAGRQELEDAGSLDAMDDFELLLRLVDFSGMRDVLAERLGWKSAQGKVPFDPISMFLLSAWQIVNGWSRAKCLRNLRNPRYADLARRFGFQDGDYPSEGGLRHFLTTLGENSLAQGQCVAVPIGSPARHSGVLSEGVWQQALLCPDGQIHETASRMRCQDVTESCYLPAPRACPGKEKGFRGCDCDTPRCAIACKRATPRDRQAGFVWYTADNQDGKKEGEGFYGYRSLPL